MRRIWWAVGLMAVAWLPVVAQKAAEEKKKQELIEIERRIGDANLNCDYKYFALIEAPEFTFIGADGSVTTREQDLAGEASCKKSTSTYTVDETNVWLNGTTAVVTGRISIHKAGATPDMATRSRFTDVFVFRGGRWQLVAGHSSRIKDVAKTP